ncbi:MFS transporter [Tsuneonella flava]|uniref:MFS transporter n=1 Tax=Tsuneonella flava TaxID=2055955 RepID=A0ABX7KE33_9SPHN|nr:MFS transporter [Tsuneonella flava]QSB45787.1 MFS transporter [Tsuneonella flava]
MASGNPGAVQSATPAAGSLLYDYFPPRVRTTVFSIYQCGNFVGGGLGIFLGGMVLDAWNSTWPDPSLAPFGLRGWQATFMLVGLPGVLVALLVSTLREPVRGRFDTQTEKKPDDESPTQLATEVRETLLSMIPFCSWFIMAKRGGGWKSIALNTLIALMITAAGIGATWLTGDKLQWITVGIGLYCVSTWTQVLSLRDRQAFETIFRCPTLLCLYIGGSAIVFKTVITFWCVPYFQRAFGLEASEVGTTLGLGGMVLGLTGLILGGILADRLRLKSVRGKLYVMIGGLGSAVLAAAILLLTSNVLIAYISALSIYMFGAMAMGPAVSTAADLAIPRVRGTAVAFYIMATSLIGTALGPYVIGLVSDAIASTGVDSAEALRRGMLWGLTMPVVGILALVIALRFVDRDTARIQEQT